MRDIQTPEGRGCRSQQPFPSDMRKSLPPDLLRLFLPVSTFLVLEECHIVEVVLQLPYC